MTDEELIARMDHWVEQEVFGLTASDILPIRDRIEALVKERDDLEATAIKAATVAQEQRARAERLEAALRKIAEGNFIGRAEGYAFAALKGADHE